MAKHNISKVSVEELSAKQAKAEHGRLHAELVEHDKRYYQQDTPTISDAEYDALRKRYGDIEQRFPNLRTLESLTLKVGVAPTGRFAKVRHAVPMLSQSGRSAPRPPSASGLDRKSTRLNSSHTVISYAVFC